MLAFIKLEKPLIPPLIFPFTIKRLVSDDLFLWERKCWNFSWFSLCKTFCWSLNSGRSVLLKTVGKPDTGWLICEKIVTSIFHHLSGQVAGIAFLSLLSPVLKQSHQTVSSPFWFVWLLFHPISELIHLAAVLNLTLSPWIVLTGFRGTEFNRRINLFRGLGPFNLGLALIGFCSWCQRVFFIEEVSDV